MDIKLRIEQPSDYNETANIITMECQHDIMIAFRYRVFGLTFQFLGQKVTVSFPKC